MIGLAELGQLLAAVRRPPQAAGLAGGAGEVGVALDLVMAFEDLDRLLGKLVLVNRKARKGRNPATGEIIDIPAKRGVNFRVAKIAKVSMLK